jgi:acetyl-CoA C-acetyltransferase
LGTEARQIYPTITAPGAFAMMATAYFAKYGIDPKEGKRLMAMVSKKSHDNGLLNEKAHLRKQVTLDQIINSPMVAWPLGLFDCSGVSDGAAAAIVARADIAQKLRSDPIWVKAMQIALSSGQEFMYQSWDGTHIISTEVAANRAYAEAGIKNPREELSVLQLHDCFSITEMVTYEDIHVSERGKAGQDIENGFFNLDGGLPAQTDGGLKCFGHPIAASGLRMMYEIYKQLQGKAEKRQVKNPRLGLTHNLGGFPAMNISSISIVGNEKG